MSSKILLQSRRSFSMLFFFFFFFFFLLLVSSLLGKGLALPTNLRAEDCEPKSCGNGLNISYPFWLQDRHPPYCGYPTFKVTCKGSDPDPDPDPVLNLVDHEYLIKDIFYEDRTVLVSQASRPDSGCSFPSYNLTLDQTLFRVNSTNRCLFFLFNCSTKLTQYKELRCSDDPTPAYFAGNYSTADGPKFNFSCESVVVLAFPDPATDGDDYTVLLKAGFLLDWNATDCGDCRRSGGHCGYDDDWKSFMCICPDGPQRGYCRKDSNKTKIIIGVATGGGVFLVMCVLWLFWHRYTKSKRLSPSSKHLIRNSSLEISPKDPELGSTHYQTHVFTYEELQEATDCFDASRELGDGGFGTVYKGKLQDGRVVAVKRLYDNNYKRVEQFMNEIGILSRLRHPNLVTLYGCTSHRSRELLLVYEFVPKGTVADHLHGSHASERALTWPIRLNIAIETADALAYLHAVDPQIIHRDVKTNNILLDSSFHVKVADFGLSRLFPTNATHVSTAPQGTPGYLDPEYHQCYQLTDRSDVYSFGVVLVELISSKPAVDITRHRHEINLASMAINKIQNCQLEELVDASLGYQSDWAIKKMITMVAEVAFRCLQSDGEMRPPIKEVLEVLKEIKRRGYQAENEGVTDARMSDDAGLLKNIPPFSPDSVTAKWVSRSTTPNTSE